MRAMRLALPLAVRTAAAFAAVIAAVACSSGGKSGWGSDGGASSGGSSSSGGSASTSSGGSGSGSTSGSSSGSTSGSSSGSSSGGSGNAAQDCVDTINQYRATLGLPAYARWTSAETCASAEAQKDATANQPHSAFPSCGEFAQNECPGWPGPPDAMIGQCLQMMWMEGPGGGHYDNMTSKTYTQVACGFYTLGDGSVWAAQDFQ